MNPFKKFKEAFDATIGPMSISEIPTVLLGIGTALVAVFVSAALGFPYAIKKVYEKILGLLAKER